MSNSFNELPGILRDSHGKGPARRLRQSGMVPGVVYGQGHKTIGVAVNPKEASKMLLGPLRRNVMIHLNLDDKSTKTVMVKDLQIDPVRRDLTHIDFIEINPKDPVKAQVPVVTFGKSKSVVAGGKLEQVHHKIALKVLPAEIPAKIELDITDLEFGATPASTLQLPAGVELAIDPSEPIVTIKMPRADKDAATEEETAAAAPEAAPAA